MAGKKWIHHETSGEFELDLAPLLAVMVKLVPVLLISSAFMQLMIIETELPQVVKDAVEQNNKPDPNAAKIHMEVDGKSGFKVVVTQRGQDQEVTVPTKNGAFDYPALHEQLIGIKKAHPEVFKIDLMPGAGVEYGDLIKVMEEARRARDPRITFPVVDNEKKTETQTPFMFPEIVFANSLESSI